MSPIAKIPSLLVSKLSALTGTVPLSKFNTSVLIDRNHKKFPIKIDFKGISLSTSIEENVNVVFENNKSYAFID